MTDNIHLLVAVKVRQLVPPRSNNCLQVQRLAAKKGQPRLRPSQM